MAIVLGFAQGTLLDSLTEQDVAYVRHFPLGGFRPPQSNTLASLASRLAATPMEIALVWLLQRAANILLIPRTAPLLRSGAVSRGWVPEVVALVEIADEPGVARLPSHQLAGQRARGRAVGREEADHLGDPVQRRSRRAEPSYRARAGRPTSTTTRAGRVGGARERKSRTGPRE